MTIFGVRRLIALLLLLPGLLAVRAESKTQTCYVAPRGDDRWPGSEQRPLRNLSAAIERSRAARAEDVAKVEILLDGGTYALDKPLVLTAEDSGLVIAAWGRQSPVLTGGTVIRGWRTSAVNPNIWQTTIPAVRDGNWIFHELFFNGGRKPRTRIPRSGFFRVAGKGIPGAPFELQTHFGEIAREWARSGDTELVALTAWAQTRNQIRGVSAESNIVLLAGQALANAAEANCRYYVENAPVELEPGEWHLDVATGMLSYWPEAGEDVYNAVIIAPRLYDLVRIEGKPELPAHDIVFRGITFADADWPLEGGSDVDPQAAVETPAAVQSRFARNCAFERCRFERLGGYALELGRGCERDKVNGCQMNGLGAGGIRVGEENLAEAEANPCASNIITDNHIHDIGLVNAPGVGIFVLLSGGNVIAHNEVDHTYYTAISVGWSWGYAATPCRSNMVEFNHLHDIGQGMLSDMGGVYTLGVQPGTVVRDNLIHDVTVFGYGGWGLYTDEGSSDILLENNIVYRCQSAGFHQHYGQRNIIRNNIFALNTDAQLMRTRVEDRVSFIFTNNIVYFDTGKLLSGRWGDDLLMDHNLYFDSREKAGDAQTRKIFLDWQKRGHDRHSWLGIDPLFVAPGRGDFRLQTNSPALRFGFQPIDLSGAGVRWKYRRP